MGPHTKKIIAVALGVALLGAACSGSDDSLSETASETVAADEGFGRNAAGESIDAGQSEALTTTTEAAGRFVASEEDASDGEAAAPAAGLFGRDAAGLDPADVELGSTDANTFVLSVRIGPISGLHGAAAWRSATQYLTGPRYPE